MKFSKVVLVALLVSVATVAYGDVSIDFPESSDTWDTVYTYWWNQGDTVYGDRDLGTEEFDYVTLVLPVTYNSLNGAGQCDFDLRLDGTTVFSWTVLPSHGTGNHTFEGAMSYTPGGTEEVRYYLTNQVVPGGGSIIIAPDQGTIDFQTVIVGVESASLGEIKAVFK
jgi:hypothetical protein